MTDRAKRAARARSAPRAYHHGNLRRELLDAALRLFEARGTLDFTLRELAREVGVTHNAPYRHFQSKSELVATLREEGFGRLVDAERKALDGTAPGSRARVSALGEASVRFALDEPVAFRLMLALPAGETAADNPREIESYAILEHALAEARASGVARTDLSPRELALAAWSLVHGLASLLAVGRLPTGEARVRRYADTLATIFFDGAAAAAAPPLARDVSSRSSYTRGRSRSTRR